MKKILIILFCLPIIGFGQQTYIPDDNFEAYLEANGMGNGVANDDYVTTANINTVTYLAVFNLSITDLTGIEAFISLQTLYVYNNFLTSIDISNNTNLEFFSCFNNQLTTLDISNNLALIRLYCYNNQLTFLDLTSQQSFIELFIQGNNLTSLDISHMSCPGLLEANLSNPNLFCIQVTDVDCWYEPFTSWMIDSSFQYFSDNCSETAIEEIYTCKNLIKTIDILGRETNSKGFNMEIYDDGSVEKKYILE